MADRDEIKSENMGKNSPALSEWIDEYASTGTVRLAARDNNGWIDRRKLLINVDFFRLKLQDTPEQRYQLSFEQNNNGIELEQRVRSVFQVIGVNEDQKLQRDNIKIIIEIIDSDINQVPDYGDEAVILPGRYLRYVDEKAKKYENFKSASANRVAGLRDEKEKLTRFLETGNSSWGLSEPTGIILEGPPGTGKTELVMETCLEEYGTLPITISGPEILSKWVGESEQHLREKFDEALESPYRILFIDELDAIARTRSEASQDYVAQLVSQLLVLLDGIDTKDKENRPLRVIASTNIAHVIDPALRRPGRLGNQPIQVGRPSGKARAAILHHYLENIYSSPDGELNKTLLQAVTSNEGISTLRQLAMEMEGFTGAEIEDIVQEAVSRIRSENQSVLTEDNLYRVLQTASSQPNKYRTLEFTTTDLKDITSGSISVDQSVMQLAPDDTSREKAEHIAKRYFKKLDETRSDDKIMGEQKYIFRIVEPRHILANTATQTRDRTAEVFQHIESERVCLYLRNAFILDQARSHSSMVRAAIEALNDQLIHWDDENILLLDNNENVESLLFLG